MNELSKEPQGNEANTLLANVNAYSQCQNCRNKRYQLFGKLHCKSEGTLKVSELKNQNHCAAQHQIYVC